VAHVNRSGGLEGPAQFMGSGVNGGGFGGDLVLGLEPTWWIHVWS
jgi:hypothetical protein